MRNDAWKDLIEFAPRIKPDNFKCFFATAKGWGCYSQRIRGAAMTARLSVSWGVTVISELRLACESREKVAAKIESKDIPLSAKKTRDRLVIRFKDPVEIKENQSLRVSVG